MAHLSDPYWAGVVRFFIGRVGATEAVEELLSSKEPDPLSENLFRVASWMSEAVDKGDWRRQVLIQLGQLVVKGNLPVAMRQRAALALARTNESGVLSFLRQLLQQQDPALRRVALASIAPLGAEITLEVAEKMFRDSNPQVRASAVFALTWLNDPMVENPLLTTLVEPDEPMNRAAAEGLALNGTALAYDILREATLDNELHIRRAAVHGLMQLDLYWAVEMLDMVEREDDQWLVKSAAGSALEVIVARNKPGQWAAPQPGDQTWLIEWAAAKERAVPGGAAAMPVLLEALAEAQDPMTRIAAAISLGQLGRQNTIPDLQAALRDSQIAVREAAFISLCMIGRMWDVPVLGK
jgi:HEAT repeat protein